MKNKIAKTGIVLLVLVFAVILTSCGTMATRSRTAVEKVTWAEYTVIPSKDYIVVGGIVVRNTNTRTLSADLMEKAIEMGAHDFINVRVDMEYPEDGARVLSASAVAIRYTSETLKTTSDSEYFIGNETIKITTSGDYIFGSKEGATSSTGDTGAPPERKKFLGLF